MSRTKPINERRSTIQFCIGQPHIDHMIAIKARFGRDLVTIANDEHTHGLGAYTVRTSNLDVGIQDHALKVTGDRVDIFDTRMIVDWRKPEA